MNQLDPSVKTVWSISLLIRLLFLSAAFLAAELIIIKPNFEWFLPTGVTSAIIAFFAVLFSLVYPPLKYKFWKYEIRTEELYIEYGVLTRINTIAPYSRIQHLDVQQSVLERMLQLGRLVVYTAGTRGADIIIPGLPKYYAEALRDQLKNYSPEDAV